MGMGGRTEEGEKKAEVRLECILRASGRQKLMWSDLELELW